MLAEDREADGGSCLITGTFLQTYGFVHQCQAKVAVTVTPPADMKHPSMHSTAHFARQIATASSLQDFGFIKITGMLLSDFGSNPYCLANAFHGTTLVNLTKEAGEVCAGSEAVETVCSCRGLTPASN